MKTFLIVLHMFAFDGTSTDVPMDNWAFDSQSGCAQSVAFLNKGLDQQKRVYSCEVNEPIDPTMVAMGAKTAPKKKG